MNNIILLATYWNEIEWIEPSLEQILKIDPVEIIICDGNFDPGVENKSTDGTREVIESFVKHHKNRARMISATRVNTLTKGIDLYSGASCRDFQGKTKGRFFYSIKSQFRTNIYRINQALTFAHMSRLSSSWKNGAWVMTYDADQFYTDDLIDGFDLTNDKSTAAQLITADEYTFPVDFSSYTASYEMRTWNNMPHRIQKNMAVYPTRHFVIESSLGYHHVYNKSVQNHAGVYHHYKFRKDQLRLEKGYQLGDRKPPEKSRYNNLVDASGIVFPEVIVNSGKLAC